MDAVVFTLIFFDPGQETAPVLPVAAEECHIESFLSCLRAAKLELVVRHPEVAQGEGRTIHCGILITDRDLMRIIRHLDASGTLHEYTSPSLDYLMGMRLFNQPADVPS